MQVRFWVTNHELFSRPLSHWERAGVRVRSIFESRITAFPTHGTINLAGSIMNDN